MPTDLSAGFTQVTLGNMFGVDAVEYVPYFDAYPSPPLTSDTSNNIHITSSMYGLNSIGMTDNSNWGLYAGRLGLGHAIFEAAGWSSSWAFTVGVSAPWFLRGGSSINDPISGIVATLGRDGGVQTYFGSRPLVRGFHRGKS